MARMPIEVIDLRRNYLEDLKLAISQANKIQAMTYDYKHILK